MVPGVEVVVLSDGGATSLSDVPTGGADVRFVPVGRSDDNAAIIAIDLRRSPSSELQRQLFVTAQNFGGSDQDGSVEVYLNDELVGLRTESLPPDTPVSFVFDIGGDRSGTIRVELSADDDTLDADNTAWLALAPLAQRRVTLIGGDSLTARALQADPRVSLRRFSPGPLSREVLEQSDAIVFASGNVPDGLDGRNILVLGPLPGSPVALGDEVRTPVVLGWRRTHPVLRFVEWDQIIISRSQAVVDAAVEDTVRTIIYTGRPMRILKNEYAMNWEENRADEIKDLAERAARLDSDAYGVRLGRGRHVLLFKVATENRGRVGLYARLTDASGKPLDVTVLDPATGQLLVDINASTPRIPASNMKLLRRRNSQAWCFFRLNNRLGLL